MSLPEGLLWRILRRNAAGAKFRRQHPVGPYVLDFYCASAKLAVEIDGESHSFGERPKHDEARDAFLKGRGLKVLHIPAIDVLRDPEGGAESIARFALPLHRPAGGPPPHASHGEELMSQPL